MQRPHIRLPALALALLATVLLPACTALGPRHYTTWQSEPAARTAAVDPGAPDSIDFHGIPVRSGQIVVSEQGSPLGLLMSLLSADASPWMHAGIISIEAGVPYVYESNGQIQPTWSGPPTAAVGGGVRRMTLDWFVANQSYIAIYTPPAGSDPARIVDFARQSHARYIRFDPWFDLGDASRMYCTEFVALALAAGDAPPVRTSVMSRNPSLRVLTDWLQLRTETIILAAALIEHGERVALISRDYSPAQFTAYFALKQELHRRFTPDQKIGNVLSFSAFGGLEFQPPVGAVIRLVDVAARDWDDLAEDEIDARVQRIAAENLGQGPGQTAVSTRKK